MSADRSQRVLEAVKELRNRLNGGVYQPEVRLAAAELAAEFDLSPTPMREVLARLAGEGLLEERRGQGFFLRRLSNRDVADLYRLSLAHVTIALEAQRDRLPRAGADERPAIYINESGADAVLEVDRLLAEWVAGAGGRLLSRSFARLQMQLARVRRAEPNYLANMDAESTSLAHVGAAASNIRLQHARAFYRRRIRISGKLAEALENGSEPN